MGKSWSSPQCSLCRRNGTGRESLVLLLRWSRQERRSRNRTRAIRLPPLGAGGVAAERATQPSGKVKCFSVKRVLHVGRSAALVARLPWAHETRLQQLPPLLLTT